MAYCTNLRCASKHMLGVASKQASKQTNKQTNYYMKHRTILESLTVPPLVNKFQHFMDTERSPPRSQMPATCPCSEPYQSTQSPRPFCWRSILILSSLLYLCHPSGLVPLGFPTKTLHAPLIFPYTLHAPPI